MIKFKCLVPGVSQDMPIIPAKQHSFKWVQDARKFYEHNPDINPKTTRCPGIFSILSSGWIQRAYMDFRVTVSNNGRNIHVDTELDQEVENGSEGYILGKYVNYHPPFQMQWLPMRDDTMRTILKIQSPWFVEVPAGYSLLMMPIPYSDETVFTAATGLIKGNSFLNVQMYWHVKNGVNIIEKGTPLNQMILIKDEPLDYVIEDVNRGGIRAYLEEVGFDKKHPDFFQDINYESKDR